MNRLLIALITFFLSGCLLERVGQVDRSVAPYGAHWVKEGMTRESRRDDSWACGAAETIHAADGPIFSDDDIAIEKSAIDKNDWGPRGRLFDKWVGCMQSKGYTYLEQCDARCLHP